MAEAPPSEPARPKRPYTMSHTAMAVRPPTKSTKNTQQPSIRPSFRCRPERVRGMPVRRDSRALAAEIPTARFHENDKPYLRRRAIGRLSWLGWSYRFVDFGLRQQALKKTFRSMDRPKVAAALPAKPVEQESLELRDGGRRCPAVPDGHGVA